MDLDFPQRPVRSTMADEAAETQPFLPSTATPSRGIRRWGRHAAILPAVVAAVFLTALLALKVYNPFRNSDPEVCRLPASTSSFAAGSASGG